MKVLCKIAGHRLNDTQTWGGFGRRDGDGLWLKLRTFCPRCNTVVPCGEMYLATEEARAVVTKSTAAA